MSYVYSDLLEAYARAGVARGRVVYVTSDLGRLADYEVRDKTAIMDAHFRALTDLLGPEGTLVRGRGMIQTCVQGTGFGTGLPFGKDTVDVVVAIEQITTIKRQLRATYKQWHNTGYEAA